MAAFRYFPVGSSVVKVRQTDGGKFFWWARDFPLVNSGQYLRRRTRRWEQLLEDNGWPKSEMVNVFGVTYASLRKHKIAEIPSSSPVNSEQSLDTAVLLSLLTLTSSSKQAKDLQDPARQSLESMLSDVSGKLVLKFEVLLECDVNNGVVDLRIMHTLVASGIRNCKSIRHFLNLMQNQTSASMVDLLLACARAKLLHQSSVASAKLLESELSRKWASFESDPLQAKVRPLKGKKTHRRLDPSLKEALANVSACGSQNFELAKRLSGRAFASIKRLPTVTRLQEQKVAQLMSQQKRLTLMYATPRVSIALDCSRISGEKTLVAFLINLETAAPWHCWLPVQAVRDFAAQTDHHLQVASSALQARWAYGMQSLFQDFSSHHWKQSHVDEDEEEDEGTPCSKQPALGPQNRMSSHDLLVCLDNALRSVGLDLQAFLS